MCIKKRGQITSFIIIGLILLFVVAIILYLYGVSYREELEPTLNLELVPGKLPPLTTYIEACIQKETKGSLKELAKNGGAEQSALVYFNKTKINFLCVKENPLSEYSCINKLVTRQYIESALNNKLRTKLDSCIDLTHFMDEYEVTKGELDVESTIAKDSVVIEVNYPITLNSKTSSQKVDKFSMTIQTIFPRLYELSQDIVNDEITQGYFDIDDWQFDNGVDIILQKHKVYPHTIYILRNRELTYAFAIEGSDSVGEIYGEKKRVYGCCLNRKDNVWFANANKGDCDLIQGEYFNDIMCDLGPIITDAYDGSCFGQECQDCDEKKHGSSWCEYESPIGEGMDLVGSRHIKQSCVNGKIITEECRDFREELCTQNTINDTSTAMCRPNRWQSCTTCQTQECCENDDLRDCSWLDRIDSENVKSICVPEVSPGLRFWENQNLEVCLNANTEKECDGLTCKTWAKDSAMICQRQGDCGAYFNTEKKFTKSGFYQTDLSKEITEEDFDISSGKNFLDLGFSRNINDFFSTEQNAQMQSLPLLFSVWFEFIENIEKISIQEQGDDDIKINNYAFCNMYSAPNNYEDCSKCDDDDNFPCTEYKCKSLGQRCVFDYRDGDPICLEPDLSDTTSPIIGFDETVLQSQFSISRVTANKFEGFEVSPALRPYTEFTFGIKSNEPVSCKLDFTPKNDYNEVPSFFIGDSTLRKNHNITIRVPPKIVFPNKIKEFLETQTNKGFLESLGDTLKIYDEFKKTNSREENDPLFYVLEVVDTITGSLEDLAPIVVKSLDEGSYHLFVKCIDASGNPNKEGFFIRLKIDDRLLDDKEPKIVGASPENGGISSQNRTKINIYVNEPSQCHYSNADKDFYTMENAFECETSPYRISAVKGGSYLCYAEIDTLLDSTKIFVRCADNPIISKDYQIILEKGTENRIIYPSNFPNELLDQATVQNTRLNLSHLALNYGMTVKTTASMIPFTLSTDQNACSFDYLNYDFGMMQNKMDCTPNANGSICGGIIRIENNASIVYIRCADEFVNRNVNMQSFEYSLNKVAPLAIVDTMPKGDVTTDSAELVVVVNSDIAKNSVDCSYSDKPLQGFIKMGKTGEKEFKTSVSNLEDNSFMKYFVFCQDRFGNKAQEKIEFDVVII